MHIRPDDSKDPDLAQDRGVDWWLPHGTVVLFFPGLPINLIKNLIDNTNRMVCGYGIVERSWDQNNLFARQGGILPVGTLANPSTHKNWLSLHRKSSKKRILAQF
jgi:hypothetical protein